MPCREERQQSPEGRFERGHPREEKARQPQWHERTALPGGQQQGDSEDQAGGGKALGEKGGVVDGRDVLTAKSQNVQSSVRGTAGNARAARTAKATTETPESRTCRTTSKFRDVTRSRPRRSAR